jgi:integrase
MPRSTALTKNRPELAIFRGKRDEASVKAWVDAFGNRDEARRCLAALDAFFGQPSSSSGDTWQSYIGQRSPHTKIAYSRALSEFFEWLAVKYGRPVAPHQVLRSDAEEYVNWLANRPFSLVAERAKDSDDPIRRRVFEIVTKLGGRATQRDIEGMFTDAERKADDALNGEQLAARLGRMVLHRLLIRTPTIAQLRAQHRGMAIFSTSVIDGKPIRDIYTYMIPQPRGLSRASILQRVSALSSFWKVLGRGENTGPDTPLVKYDIFDGLKSRLSSGFSSERKSRRAMKRMPPEIVPKILAYLDTVKSTEGLRDRAMFLFLILLGSRISETLNLRRAEPPPRQGVQWPGWLDATGTEPRVLLLRKGGKRMILPYPSVAYQALLQFQAALEVDSRRPRADERLRELVVNADAPLFPPLRLWGANAAGKYQEFKPNAELNYRRSMTRPASRAWLRRLGLHAGLTDDELKLLHPHALRHFAATAMIEAGKPLREVQAILGHESVTTTEGYLEEIGAAERLTGQTEILSYIEKIAARAGISTAPAQPASPPPSAPRKPSPQVIDTYAVEVQQSPAAAAPRRPEPPPPVAPPAPVAEAPPPWEVPVVPTIGEDVPLRAVDVEPGPGGVAIVDRDDRIVAVDLDAGEHRQAEVPHSPVDDVSAGSPDWAYDMFGTDDAERIEWTKTSKTARPGAEVIDESRGEKLYQLNNNKHSFLAEFYDPWPRNYGIGVDTLLPFFARASHVSDDGIVLADPVFSTEKKKIKIPALPVLAPAQIWPDTEDTPLLNALDRLYADWAGSAQPSRTYGLMRWFGAFSHITGTLLEYFRKRKRPTPTWMPYEAAIERGAALRAHSDDWLAKWFELNAHTFLVTARYMTEMKRGRGVEDRKDDEAFAEAFIGAASSGVGFAEELPVWFAEDDPVHSIYKRSADEWKRFTSWLASVTGQRLSSERKETRRKNVAFAEQSVEKRRELLEKELTFYLEEQRKLAELNALSKQFFAGDAEVTERIVSRYGITGKREYREQLAATKENVALLRAGFEAKALPLPEDADLGGRETGRDIRPLVIAYLNRYVPLAEGDPGPVNIFADSPLFDAAFFAIDQKKHTITLDESAQQRFRARFDVPFPQLVLRRACRAMWEYVVATGRESKGIRADKGDNTKLVWGVMLQYLATVVPAPEQMERQAREIGGTIVAGANARRLWLTSQAAIVRKLLTGEEVTTEEATPAQLEAAAQQMAVSLSFAAEISRVSAEEASVMELLDPETGNMSLRISRSAAEAVRAERRRSAETDIVIASAGGERASRRKKMVENPGRRVLLKHRADSAARTKLFRIGFDGRITKNPSDTHVYVTESALTAMQDAAVKMTSALPSPFRVMAALQVR